MTVRESINAGTLRSNDKGIAEVVSRWEQLLRFAALRLGRELGADVQVHLSRREQAEPSIRFAAQAESLVSRGVLFGTIRIPDAIAPIDIAADLRAGKITVSSDIDAPRDGRATTRVNWLTRQLRDAPDGLRIDAFVANSRSSTSELLRGVREDPGMLVIDAKRELRTFRVAASSPVGVKRGVGRNGFIDSVLAAVDGFYASVVQVVRPWVAKAPQLPKRGETAVGAAGIDVAPPPKDLDRAADDALVAEPEADEPVDEVIAGTSVVIEPELVPMNATPEPEPPEEFVSWDGAHEKLDHERGYDEGFAPSNR